MSSGNNVVDADEHDTRDCIRRYEKVTLTSSSAMYPELEVS